ncbi:MAG: molybdopterin-dependent oxidoreductase [candidate division Zixibacteria bacterium]|nr:molybdopterin-dependent oxidoreductase [candidate division Zixibacteria bacterium]
MERRKFLTTLAWGTSALTVLQLDRLLAATGYHEGGPYNGPLLTNYVSSTCGACPGGCGIRVRRVDDIPVAIEGNPVHPVNRGGLCPVGVAAMALLIHPDRIRQPLMRSGPRGSGQFKPVTWETAEQTLVEKLAELKSAGTPEQLLFLNHGGNGLGAELLKEFMADFGSPNLYSVFDPSAQVCSTVWGGDPAGISYDLENAHLALCFGYPVFEGGDNPVYFAGLRQRWLSVEEQKGRLIVIDPRLSATAAKAERWVPIASGTHGILALGLAYLIIKERLYDERFVKESCVGFEDETDGHGHTTEGFKSLVLRNYYPAFVSEKTGVPLDQIISLARMFATTSGAIALPGAGVTTTVDGVIQAWAVMALNALTGRLGTRGGVGKPVEYVFRKAIHQEPAAPPLVSGSTQQFPYLSGRGAIESLPERILAGTPYRIKVAILNNVNPVYDSPQANRFRQSLQNIPFSVAVTCLQDETSLLADLILPDCTFLEKFDLVLPESQFAQPVIGLTHPAIAPLYESRQAEDVFLALAKRLHPDPWQQWPDYKSYVMARGRELYQSNAGALFSDQFTVSFESLLAERGWRRKEYQNFEDFWEQLKAAGGWWDPIRRETEETGRVPGVSGKFQFQSEALSARFDRSPERLHKFLLSAGLNANGSEQTLGSARLADEPAEPSDYMSLHLIELTTLRGEGARIEKIADMIGYYDNIKWQCWVELSPDTAERLRLQPNQMVWVESPHGRKQLPLVLNPGLAPGVAAVPAGLGRVGSVSYGENIYDILAPARECLTGIPALAATKVRVYSAG